MLKNKRRQQTATFLEGLNGHYQRRESPPPIPNTMNMALPRHQTQSTTGSSTQSLQTIGIVQHPSITSSTASAPIKKHSNSALAPFNDHPKPSASSTSLPMTGLMSTSTPNGAQFGLFQQNPQSVQQQRRLSHTPRGSRTVSTRSELSSHSFSNPRQTNVIQVMPQQNRQTYVQNTNTQYPQRYSGRSDQNQKRQRRSLTSSLSIGNIQSKDPISEPTTPHDFYNVDELDHLQAKADSLQSLRNNQTYGSQQRDSASPALSALLPSDLNDLPLPSGWDIDVTAEGYRFYIDHNNQRTTWVHPLAVENLSPGWTKIFDAVHGVVYYNELEQRSQFEHPGLLNPAQHHNSHLHLQQHQQPHLAAKSQQNSRQSSQSRRSTSWANLQQQNQLAQRIRESASIQSIAQHQKQYQLEAEGRQKRSTDMSNVHPMYYETVSSINIINEDIPPWLKLYGEAPFQSDHLLKWTMFKLPQLQQFDRMLRKLYKQEVFNTVSKYERVRAEINKELWRRFEGN